MLPLTLRTTMKKIKFNFQAYNPANSRPTENCKNKNLSKIHNIACFQIK